MAEMLCHVTTREALDVERLVGLPFLHCCTEAQLLFVLVRHFAGRRGLLVLRFDPDRLTATLQWERSEPDQDPFPHLYGELPLSAVQTAPAPGDWGA